MESLLTFRAYAQMKPAVSRFCSFLILIIVVSAVNKPVLVDGGHPSAPSTLVVYLHENQNPPNATLLVVVSPSAANGGSPIGFGTVIVLDNIVRQGQAADSLLLGTAQGEAVVAKDLSFYLSDTLVLSGPSYAGSISLNGVLRQPGIGEVGISTGTGDFRWARGYADINPVSLVNGVNVYKIVLHIKYD